MSLHPRWNSGRVILSMLKLVRRKHRTHPDDSENTDGVPRYRSDADLVESGALVYQRPPSARGGRWLGLMVIVSVSETSDSS